MKTALSPCLKINSQKIKGPHHKIIVCNNVKDIKRKKDLFQLNISTGEPHLENVIKDEDGSLLDFVWVNNKEDITNSFIYGRDKLAPLLFNKMSAYQNAPKGIYLFALEDSLLKGIIVGLELCFYQFINKTNIAIVIQHNHRPIKEKVLTPSLALALAVNQARHLVNLPPNFLNPKTYADDVRKLFQKEKYFKVNIWDEKKLEKEGCGLILSVGQAALHGSYIVHLQYRHPQAKGRPIAFVGKGITFDSGGLDVKPAAGMRLMKKDMGGSAALCGLARYVAMTGPKKNIDIYLAIAENAISANASRPSDIYQAKNGLKVEIHNTDAEGRLVLADALSIAQEHKEKPAIVIDVATLTGAAKVALGQDIAALYSNDPQLENQLFIAGQSIGDYVWPMPLFRPYDKQLNSPFADMVNAASGHGGSITAALFLQRFIEEKTKWAHLDIFSWTTDNQPCHLQKGGSGQAVQLLAEYIGF